MAESNHRGKHQPLTQNQNNRMSDDPRDGARKPEGSGEESKGPVEVSPEEQAQHEPATVEAFGEAGAGIAAKE